MLIVFFQKIDEIRYIATRTNAAIIGISESKLDKTILQSEIQVSNYELLRCDRSRNGGGVTCYIRNIKNIFVEILLLKTKPLIA